MTKTITVKGIGKASASPDTVILQMNLTSLNKDYGKAMNQASENIESLSGALGKAGFEKDALKTTGFHVNMAYEGVQRKDGRYENVFKGYEINHDLKVEFGFEPERLTDALAVIGSCLAHPELSVQFTVKDPSAINDELLRAATENAKGKAEVLCSASGKKLGDLLSIDYSWGEKNLYSNTRYGMQDECLATGMAMKNARIDFTPEDIRVSDTVTFVWEINE